MESCLRIASSTISLNVLFSRLARLLAFSSKSAPMLMVVFICLTISFIPYIAGSYTGSLLRKIDSGDHHNANVCPGLCRRIVRKPQAFRFEVWTFAERFKNSAGQSSLKQGEYGVQAASSGLSRRVSAPAFRGRGSDAVQDYPRPVHRPSANRLQPGRHFFALDSKRMHRFSFAAIGLSVSDRCSEKVDRCCNGPLRPCVFAINS